jgi:hypothetical protein
MAKAVCDLDQLLAELAPAGLQIDPKQWDCDDG